MKPNQAHRATRTQVIAVGLGLYLATGGLVTAPMPSAAQSRWEGNLKTSDGDLDVALTAADGRAAILIEDKCYQVTTYRQEGSDLELTFVQRGTAVRCLLEAQSGTNGYRGPCKNVDGGRSRGQILVFPVDDADDGKCRPQTGDEGDPENAAVSGDGQAGNDEDKNENEAN